MVEKWESTEHMNIESRQELSYEITKQVLLLATYAEGKAGEALGE